MLKTKEIKAGKIVHWTSGSQNGGWDPLGSCKTQRGGL